VRISVPEKLRRVLKNRRVELEEIEVRGVPEILVRGKKGGSLNMDITRSEMTCSPT